MAFGPNTPGLAPLTGPNGTFQIPDQFAGYFPQDVAPAPAPPPIPTFAPGEIEGAPLDPIAPLAPVTPAAALPPTAFAPQPAPPAQPQAPPQPTLADATRGADATIAAVRNRQEAQPARNATDLAMGSLADRRVIAQAEGEVEAALGREEKRIYDEQGAADDAATKQRNAERERANKEMEAARTALRSSQDAYVNHKVDRGRLWNNATNGQKFMAAIGIAMSALGGALVARDTGRPVTNPALDLLMGAIESDVRDQLADRDKLAANVGMKRDAITDLRQQYQDGEAAYQGIVAGNLRRAENQVKAAAAAAKDPLAKLKLENFSAEIGMKAAEVQQAAEDREVAAKQAERSYRLASRGQALAEKKYNRDVFESDRNFGEDQRRFDITTGIAAQKAAADIENAAKKLEKEGQDKEAKEVRELSIGGFQKKPLLNADGTVFKGPTPEATIALRKQTTAGAEAIRLIDQIKKLRNQHGAEWGKTEAGRQLKANMAALQLEIKNTAELGVLAGPDMGLIESYIGSGDPTEFDAFGSIDKGLDEVRNNVRAKVQRTLETANFTGSWDPPDLSNIDTTKTEADKATEAIQGAKTPSQWEASGTEDSGVAGIGAGRTPGVVRSIFKPLGDDHPLDRDTPRDKRAARDASSKLSNDLPGASREQEPLFKGLGMMVNGKDPTQAKRARENLAELARNSNPEIRTAAIVTMERAGMVDEAKAAVEALPEKGRKVHQAAQEARTGEESVSRLEAIAAIDPAALWRLADLARTPGPMQKDAGAALLRLRKAGR